MIFYNFQISESRRDLSSVPILVIGNKTDKVHQVQSDQMTDLCV